MSGKVIGYELNDRYSQISYFDEKQQEPMTVESNAEHSQIPLIIGLYEQGWVYGSEAKRLQEKHAGLFVDDLYGRVRRQEKVILGDKTYESIWLLAKFVELTLMEFEAVAGIVFTVPEMSVDVGKMLKGIGQRAGIEKANVYVQDYKESFCNYMLYQPKELWQYEAALFYCDRHEVKAYMLRKLRTGSGKGSEVFVTVDEVASAQMQELAAIYPVLNVDRAKDADTRFCQFIQGVFDKKLVSSVFLVGEGFENNWYPQSLRVLCNGRRAFQGNNLYSKGACYTAYKRNLQEKEHAIYLDESKMTEQICIRIRNHGQEEWFPLVSWGTRWYEADTRLEVIPASTQQLELHVESLARAQVQALTIPLERLPKRKDYSLRLEIKVIFIDDKTCKICLRDMGFGEFFPATDFKEEFEIQLGGVNGQFHSLS